MRSLDRLEFITLALWAASLASLAVIPHNRMYIDEHAILPHFSMTYPTLKSESSLPITSGTTVIRAPGSHGRHCIVHVFMQNSYASILQEYLSTIDWMEADIIMLTNMTSYEEIDQWVTEYHSTKYLSHRSGLIRQAIVWDFDPRHNILFLDSLGRHGIQANMDLLSTVYKFAGSRARVNGALDPSMSPIVEFLLNLASSNSRALHTPFLSHSIDSMTVKSAFRNESGAELKTLTVLDFSQLVIRTTRAFNGLSERLHHSQFMYIPLPGYKFIGFNTYIYCSLIAGTTIGLYMIYHIYYRRTSFAHHEESFLAYKNNLIISVVLAASPYWLSTIPTNIAQFLWVLCLILGSALALYLAKRRSDLNILDWETVRLLSAFVFLVVISPLGIYNYALAYFAILFSVPPLLLTRPRTGLTLPALYLQSLVFFLCSPGGILLFFYCLTWSNVWEIFVSNIILNWNYDVSFAIYVVYLPVYLSSLVCCLCKETRLIATEHAHSE